jgi:hypothetical protein
VKLMIRSAAVLATLFVVFGFLFTVQSRAAAADQGKATVSVSQAATVGTTKLDPGDYEVKADATSLTFSPENGRPVAKVSIQWKDETGKSPSSNVEVEGGKIIAVHFEGKARFAAISE